MKKAIILTGALTINATFAGMCAASIIVSPNDESAIAINCASIFMNTMSALISIRITFSK